MNIDEFWSLVGLLKGRVDTLSAERLTQALAKVEPQTIEEFEESLAAHLHALDHPVRADQEIFDLSENAWLTMGDDLFLYARCAVVAAGPTEYARVLNDPLAMRSTWYAFDGEHLLNVAESAYRMATGTQWTFEPSLDYETGSNVAAWSERDG